MVSDSFLLEQIERTALRDLQRPHYRPKILAQDVCQHVAAGLRGCNLVLGLGAGISYPSKIPTWQTLITKAGESALANTAVQAMAALVAASQLSPPARVRFYESVLGLRSAFRNHLANALYSDYVPGPPRANMLALANFILGKNKVPRIATVVTYNFDDLLETALRHVILKRRLRMKVRSIFSEESYQQVPSASTIDVFHPHGYLPTGATAEDIAALPIVFSEQDYHAHFLDHTFWANTLQLSLYSTRHCLFVGLSFSDPNLRRLLDCTKGSGVPRHVAIRALHKGTPGSGSQHMQNYIAERDLESLGVRTLWVRSHDRIGYALRKILTLGCFDE